MEELYMKLTSPNSGGLTEKEFEEYKSLTTESMLSERKVLKVGSSQPQMPMDVDPNAMPQVPNMGGMPMDDGMGMDEQMPPMDNGGSEFDTNFDAGVEADEDEDPKKYIQQLTGKLSQELGKYNNELGEPDTELSKYVGGMIVKQVAKNLDDAGKKELIKKINTTDSSADEDIPTEDMGDENLDGDAPEQEMPMESYILTKKDLAKLYENFNVVDNERKVDDLKINKETKLNERNKPFIAPKFNK